MNHINRRILTLTLILIIIFFTVATIKKINIYEAYINNRIEYSKKQREDLDKELLKYKSMSDYQKQIDESFNVNLNIATLQYKSLSIIDKLFNTNENKSFISKIDYLNEEYKENYEVLIERGKLLDTKQLSKSEILDMLNNFQKNDYLKQISIMIKKPNGYINFDTNKNDYLSYNWTPNINIDKNSVTTVDKKRFENNLDNNKNYRSYIGTNTNGTWVMVCFEEI